MAHLDTCTSILGWIECHPGLAGYLQALGSLAAICVALFSPQIAARYVRKEREAQDREHTQSLASWLNSQMPKVLSRCSEIKHIIEAQVLPPPEGMGRSEWFDKIGFVMHPGLVNVSSSGIVIDRHDDVDPLTPYGRVALRLMSYNNKRCEIQADRNTGNLEVWKSARATLIEGIGAASDAAKQAVILAPKRWPWQFQRRD